MMETSHSAVAVLAQNGKSFYFAGVFLPADRLKVISELYSFCRYVDDCADELSHDQAKTAVAHIKEVILNSDLSDPLQDQVRLLEKNGVARTLLLDLVRGAEWDIHEEPIHTADDLDKYCYHVAGVVGLMMNPLMKVTDPAAASYAVSLGKAMQLTNICRDILEDAQNARIYLPATEIRSLGLGLTALATPGAAPTELKTVLKKYLKLADASYELGQQGLPYIPLRCRFVILIASEVYRHIGKKIIKNDFEVLKGRIYLTVFEKIVVLFKTSPKMLKPAFWLKPLRPNKQVVIS
ncbi:hypothetical protein AZI86_01100 [Bdellovibrio bacteriovorus]|uniref:Phytoene synthase n=1 Tax=Bdellovibrio bacteriovorus TaxID=959 RepID=A0A150WMH7_BDEBC|nr:phytoene/squalene synthase family protein [Bdellovibrio bacteriovorus]KYG65703.1 hypothetical protein AZI86_01100 [Bdellovibrio bacteriovorus]